LQHNCADVANREETPRRVTNERRWRRLWTASKTSSLGSVRRNDHSTRSPAIARTAVARPIPSVTRRRPVSVYDVGNAAAAPSGSADPGAAAAASWPVRRRSGSDECRPRSTRCARRFTRLRGTGSLAARYPPARSCLMHTLRSSNRVALLLAVPRRHVVAAEVNRRNHGDCGSVLGLSFGALIRSRPDGDSQLRARCA
jgi:hypothetical protein